MSAANGYATGGNEQPERTGKYLGLGTLWRAQRGTWREVWLRDDPPAAAKVTVRRLIEGQVFESSAVAHLHEHADDSPAWREMAASTLAAIAAGKALRQVFPRHWREYVAEEAQADTPAVSRLETPADAARPFSALEAAPHLPLTDEQRMDVAGLCGPLDENAIAMLCIAAGVEDVGELTQATLPAFEEALAAHVAGVVV